MGATGCVQKWVGWHLLPLLENLESMGPEMIEKITETLKSECENKHGLCHRDKNNYSPSHIFGGRFRDVCENYIPLPACSGRLGGTIQVPRM